MMDHHKEQRIKKINETGYIYDALDKRLLLLGFGAVGSTFLPIFLRHVKIPHQNILVIDANKNNYIKNELPKTINFKQIQINENNYKNEILAFLRKGKKDILVELSYELSTLNFIKLCFENDILFVNTAIDWYKNDLDTLSTKNPSIHTLYYREKEIRNYCNSVKSKKPTVIVSMGENPGVVNLQVKTALKDFFNYLKNSNKLNPQTIQLIEKALEQRKFNIVAGLLKIRVVQISEIDTQYTKSGKKPYVFKNTWSCAGFRDEAYAPAELSFGTHETSRSPLIVYHDDKNKNHVCLRSRGANTLVLSQVSSGQNVGVMIRHDEANSIGNHLTFKDESGNVLYAPTVYYAYRPSLDSISSLFEFQSFLLEHEYQPKTVDTIMFDDIVDGRDEVGVLLLSEYGSWWIGSLLDIHEAREIVPHKNPTTIQVVAGILAGVLYCFHNPNEGYKQPDDLDETLPYMLPLINLYLGPIKSGPVDWKLPEKSYVYGQEYNLDNIFDIRNFIISPIID